MINCNEIIVKHFQQGLSVKYERSIIAVIHGHRNIVNSTKRRLVKYNFLHEDPLTYWK